jgi:glycosyltransferase involved in cell wall biosynthesis
MSLIGVLIMVKNEEKSIATTINSVKNIKNIIVFDTGSKDKTISIIDSTCRENKQTLYLKQGVFKTFPESRNEAIEFAETVKVKYLLLLDAGDELRLNMSFDDFMVFLSNLDPKIRFGVVKHRWLEENNSTIAEHTDLRLIKNKSGCRYDISTPVHEAFSNVDYFMDMSNEIILYQDRIKYGVNTQARYKKDIELLKAAKPSKRNYYFLGQTYMNMKNFNEAFKYNVLSIEFNENDSHQINGLDEQSAYIRAGYCAMMTNKDVDVIFKYLDRAIKFNNPSIDSYIFMFKTAIDYHCIDRVLQHIETVFNMKKPEKSSTVINHFFYDYVRWNLISIICLISKTKLQLGKEACKLAIQSKYQHPDDLKNSMIYQSLDL